MSRFFRIFRWVAPIAAVVLMAGLMVRAADDTPATAPSTGGDSGGGSGSVVVTVNDASGSPVAGASVMLHTKVKPADGSKPPHGKTDSDGKYTFTGVAPGDYTVMAKVKGGGAGHEKVTVADGSTPTAVTVTLGASTGKSKKDKNPPSDNTPPAPPSDTPPAATQPAGN